MSNHKVKGKNKFSENGKMREQLNNIWKTIFGYPQTPAANLKQAVEKQVKQMKQGDNQAYENKLTCFIIKNSERNNADTEAKTEEAKNLITEFKEYQIKEGLKNYEHIKNAYKGAERQSKAKYTVRDIRRKSTSGISSGKYTVKDLQKFRKP